MCWDREENIDMWEEGDFFLVELFDLRPYKTEPEPKDWNYKFDTTFSIIFKKKYLYIYIYLYIFYVIHYYFYILLYIYIYLFTYIIFYLTEGNDNGGGSGGVDSGGAGPSPFYPRQRVHHVIMSAYEYPPYAPL